MEPIKVCRRRRKRRQTISQRFGPTSVALELGLLRLTLELERELEKKEDKNAPK